MVIRRGPSKGIGQKLSVEMGLDVHRHYPQYTKTTLYWHMQEDVEVDVDKSHLKNTKRPRKTTVCDCLQIIQTL